MKKAGCGSVLLLILLIAAATQLLPSNKPATKPSLAKGAAATVTTQPTVKPTTISKATATPTTNPPVLPQITKNSINVNEPQTSDKYTTLKKGEASLEILQLKERLQELGYIGNTQLNRNYTDHTTDAVKRFQDRNGLTVTGDADPKTQALLFSGIALSSAGQVAKTAPTSNPQGNASGSSSFQFSKNTGPAATPQQNATEAYVWVSKTGSKYHSRSNCSNMKNPSQMLRSTAISKGLNPCKVCKPK